MWFNILPAAAIIVGCLTAPPSITWLAHYFVLSGKGDIPAMDDSDDTCDNQNQRDGKVARNHGIESGFDITAEKY